MVLRAYLEEELGGSSEFLPPLPDAQSLCLLQSSSFSSITDSTMSLNIITVTLNMGESDETPCAYCILTLGRLKEFKEAQDMSPQGAST